MCSSESDLSFLSPIGVPAVSDTNMTTRKRSRTNSFVVSESQVGQEEAEMIMNEKGFDDEFVFGDVDQGSDDDFIADKKKRPSKYKKKPKKTINNSKTVLKSSSNVSVSENSSPAEVTVPPNPSTSPMVIIKSSGEELLETKLESDVNSNFSVERPLVISTPDQINRRSPSFDEEEFTTPSSTPIEERQEEKKREKVVQTMVSEVVKSVQFPPAASTSVVPSDGQVPIIPVSTIPPSLQVQAGVTTSQADQPPTSLSQATTKGPPSGRGSRGKVSPTSLSQSTPTGPPSGRGGRGKVSRPVQLHRPGLNRQAAPGPRHPIRPGAPRLLRLTRPGLPRQPMGGQYRMGGPRPRAQPLATGPRLFNVRSVAPVKHHSLSTPQYSSQNIPPVVELDNSPPRSEYMNPSSPPRSDQTCSSSPPSSVVSKLTSLGVSVAREKVPATNSKHGWVLPPGLSVTKTTPNREDGPSLSLQSLANALLKLGDGEEGRKRLVQYNLSENQIGALNALGVREEAM